MTEPLCPLGAEERAGLYLAGLPWCPHVSDAELADFERRWRKAMEHPNRVKVLTPLPRRVRLRLAADRAIDKTAIWLGSHIGWGVTEWLWRATGLLGRRRQA